MTFLLLLEYFSSWDYTKLKQDYYLNVVLFLACLQIKTEKEYTLNRFYICVSDVPNFSDPHIPVVAREILQRMISQFAAEYTSKTSSPQDGRSDSPPHSDQSRLAPLLPSGTTSTSPANTLVGAAQNQNPVLSKLLMADQDAPLDLTIKKPMAEPHEQGSLKQFGKIVQV